MPTMLATSGDISGGEMMGGKPLPMGTNQPCRRVCMLARAARVCVCVVAGDAKNVCADSSGLKRLTLGLGAE